MGQLADYVLYLLLKVFERKKKPHTWEVTEPKNDIIVKIYQYQVELEGGQRHGPQWNHYEECKTYLEKNPVKGNHKIVRFWSAVSKTKLRFVEPELIDG